MIALQSSEESVLSVTTVVDKFMPETISFSKTVSGNWIVIICPIGNH